MLIYIRHGTSTLGRKSAEKLNKAERGAPSAQPRQVSGLPDQRTAAFGKSDQKTDICLEGTIKNKKIKKTVCLAFRLAETGAALAPAGGRNDKSAERAGTVLEPATTVTFPRGQR